MRQSANDVKKQINQQEDDIYGDETVSGTNPNNEKIQAIDTDDHLAKVIGNSPTSAFNIGDEINEDEESL